MTWKKKLQLNHLSIRISMKKFISLLLTFNLFLFHSFLSAQQNYTQYVEPMIGTGGHGHTFPGATVPFGMVQLSPDTRIDGSWDGCSGYHNSDSVIYGFSHTHLSGTGCSDYGDIMIMPMMGASSWDNKIYSSKFSHKNEKASPGFYSVKLDDDNIDVADIPAIIQGIEYSCQQGLIDYFVHHNQPGKASWLLSSNFKGSGNWLRCCGGSFYGRYEILPREFVNALRMRLLLGVVSPPSLISSQLSCHCRTVFSADSGLFHLIDCKEAESFTKTRHNNVRDALFDFLRSVCPSAQLTKEPILQASDLTMVRPDIQFNIGNTVQYIDVMVTDPAAESHRHLNTHTDPDVTASAGEQMKRASYARRLPSLAKESLVPFVVEATGRLGPAATLFLKQVSGGHHDSAITTLTCQIGALVTRYNSQAIGALSKLVSVNNLHN